MEYLISLYTIIRNEAIEGAQIDRSGLLNVECQSFCPNLVTVFMSAFKSTDQVLVGESDNGNQNQSSRIL